MIWWQKTGITLLKKEKVKIILAVFSDK